MVPSVSAESSVFHRWPDRHFSNGKTAAKGNGRTATNPCRRRRQRQRQRRARLSRRRNRTDHSPVPTALAGSNSLFYKPSQPYNVPSNKLCFCCHGAGAFSLQLFPCDIFGEVNFARVQNNARGRRSRCFPKFNFCPHFD